MINDNILDDTADNPWASAAARNEATAKSSLQLDPPLEIGTAREEEEEVDPDSCSFLTLYNSLKLWHILDLLIGFFVILYGSIVASGPVSDIAVVFILGVGILLLSRALCGAASLWTESFCHKCGLPISAGISPVLACTWFVLMFINLVAPGHVRKYLQEHHMLWQFLQKWEAHHQQTLTLILLAAFLVECARWQLVQNLHRKLTRLENTEDVRARERSDRRNRLADRPWWFPRRRREDNQDHDPLTDSLLPVTADRQPQSSSWSFFGRPRRGEYENVREDASVDFASVQEDWAGRTEEDPYWWSRDDDSSAENEEGTSWAENK